MGQSDKVKFEMLNEFRLRLIEAGSNGQLEDFCRSKILHGTPFIFSGREEDFFRFKRRICQKFDVSHTEIFVVGSARLGFSALKGTDFTLDSDIDIAIASRELFSHFAGLACGFEYSVRSHQIVLRGNQWAGYHKFLRYLAIGWVRPDLLPFLGGFRDVREDWFDFFESISFDRSEVGNYKISGAIYNGYEHLERYAIDSINKILKNLTVEGKQ